MPTFKFNTGCSNNKYMYQELWEVLDFNMPCHSLMSLNCLPCLNVVLGVCLKTKTDLYLHETSSLIRPDKVRNESGLVVK